MDKINTDTQDTLIPNKMFYKIGEISRILGVKPYVLRYWETEFKQIKPSKNRFGQRVYRPKDLSVLLRVKELLYKRKFTIAGAKKQLEADRIAKKQKENKGASQKDVDFDKTDFNKFLDILREHKTSLKEILNIFESKEIHSETNIGA